MSVSSLGLMPATFSMSPCRPVMVRLYHADSLSSALLQAQVRVVSTRPVFTQQYFSRV